MTQTIPAATYVRETSGGCQWIGADQDPRLGPIHYCGKKPLWPGRSYCEEHVWQVYKKGTSVGVSRKNRAIEKEMALIKELEGVDHE
jgi:hypothetical protein